MCDEKWIWYDNQWWPTQWLDREEAPKPNFHQRRSWLLFGGLLPVWSTIAFWIPVKPFPLRCMLSKLSRCNKSGNACSRHWSAEWLNSSLWQCPTTCHPIKVEQIGLQSFASSFIFTWPLTNQLPLLQASRQFFQRKHFHNQQEAENAFQGFTESWSLDFYATGINQLDSHLKNCVDFNNSYFD